MRQAIQAEVFAVALGAGVEVHEGVPSAAAGGAGEGECPTEADLAPLARRVLGREMVDRGLKVIENLSECLRSAQAALAGACNATMPRQVPTPDAFDPRRER